MVVPASSQGKPVNNIPLNISIKTQQTGKTKIAF
jgi:hypothetical protein